MKNKLKTKDLIFAGAFGALYIILMLIIVMVSGMIPILFILSPLSVGIACATVYLLYVTKVKKFGAIFILAVLFGMATGMNFVFSFIVALAAGLAAELIARVGNYESRKWISLSYCVFNITMVGPFTMLAFAKSTFITMCEEYYGYDYAAAIDRLTPGWVMWVLVGLAVLGAAIGMVLANRFMKKHFEKAGVV